MNVSRLLHHALRHLCDQLREEGAGNEPSASAQTTDRPQIRAHTPDRESVVIGVRGDIEPPGAALLRDVLVDTAVRDRPRRLIIDLRHVGTAGAAAVRALVDGYRAAGHSGPIASGLRRPVAPTAPIAECLRAGQKRGHRRPAAASLR